jgi:hypothetical protein
VSANVVPGFLPDDEKIFSKQQMTMKTWNISLSVMNHGFILMMLKPDNNAPPHPNKA